jgi:hypothetical protein
MCENILCYIMFILQNLSIVPNNPTEEYLSILKSSKFWNIILKAIGNVEKLNQNSYIQHIRTSIYELNKLLLEKMINLGLLKQILEYSDEYLSNHFANLKMTKGLNHNIISQDEIVAIRILYDDHSNRFNQLDKFYQEFCTSPKVIDVDYYIKDLRLRKQNLDKVKLYQLLVTNNYWKSHDKILLSAERCYKLINFQTFRNVFEIYFQKDNLAKNVEYIALKLMPSVFSHYISMCKKFQYFEKIGSIDALLFWKNIKNINDEFDSNKELSRYKNSKLLQTLENLLKFPKMMERLEQLEKIEKILQIQRMENNFISKSIKNLKDNSLLLEKVNSFIDYLEENFSKIDENCWNLIKVLSNSKKFLDFLSTISDDEIKNLIYNINDDDNSGENMIPIQEDIILSLIQIKQIFYPLINKKMKNIVEFLEELSIIISKDSTLVNKFILCNNDALQNFYYNVSNIEKINKRKIKNIISDGFFIFLRDENKCSIILILADVAYDRNYILKLREKVLLMKKESKDFIDFIDLVDTIQKIIIIATKLIQNGHFDYREFEKEIKGIRDMKEFLTFLNDDLEKW